VAKVLTPTMSVPRLLSVWMEYCYFLALH